MKTSSRFSIAVVCAVISLYPRVFRERYGPEMEQFVLDAVAERAGVRRRNMLPDLVLGAMRERIAARRLSAIRIPQSSRPPNGGRMGTLLQDLRNATRTLRRNPGFAFVVLSRSPSGSARTR